MKNIAIVPAAGDGKRFGGHTAKIFVPLAGRPLLSWTLQAFEDSLEVGGVILAIRPEDQESVDRLVADGQFRKVVQMVAGGRTRQESVSHALFHLEVSPEIVVVHDAARPLVTPAMIDLAVATARDRGAVVFGIPPRDTVKEVKDANIVKATLPRDSLRLIQTPEAFQFPILLKAYLQALDPESGAVDDAELVERLGVEVTVLPGDPQNVKITVPEDIRMAERFNQTKSI